MAVTPTPQSTPYEVVGSIPGLGSLELTYLANSYADAERTTLAEFFPDENIIPRTVTIETTKTSLGLMRMVDMGMQDAASMPNDIVERRTVEPAVFRESDFLDRGFVNQIRDYANENSAVPVSRMIQERVQRLVAKRNRTIDFFRSQVLLGGINYTDPITKANCDVSTQIPESNFFHYQGYMESVNKGETLSEPHQLRAYASLSNTKGRPEALLFQNTDGEAGVPWTHPRADIPKALRWIQHHLYNKTRNRFTDMVVTHDLLTVIMENELIKAYSGRYGFINYDTRDGSGTQGQNITHPGATNPYMSFDETGMLTSIAGLNIITMENKYLDPHVNEHIKMWPVNKVTLVARNYMGDSSQTIGRTVHPVAEGPNQEPGLWIYTSEEDYHPPHPPGRTMQIGDAFIPFAIYPEWISVLTVCEEDDVFANSILRSDIDFNLAM
jgi:hypothetical protein